MVSVATQNVILPKTSAQIVICAVCLGENSKNFFSLSLTTLSISKLRNIFV